MQSFGSASPIGPITTTTFGRPSSDGGRTWPQDTELILHQANLPSQTWNKQTMQDAWAEMGKFSVGLPATALTREGDLAIVHYAGMHTDRTGIEW